MTQSAIFLPMSALALFTFVILLLIPIRRFRAGFQQKVTAEDFRYGESRAVPGEVSIPNRNYMNLLELPVLFYVVCLASYVTSTVDRWELMLAWVYVGLRVVHSMIHVTYNKVIHRLTIFALSNFVLVAIWLVFLRHIWPVSL